MWVLGIVPGSSGGAAGALNLGAIFPAPPLLFFFLINVSLSSTQGWPETRVVQAGLKFMEIPLLLVLKCWN